MSKPLLQQLRDGLLNAVGIDVKQAKTIKSAKGKGVVVPKLKPIPTVKRGKNPNSYAAKKELAEQNKLAQISKRVAHIERAEKADAKRDAQILKAIRQNKRAIDAQSKMIKKQRRWVAFMLRKWEQKNAKMLSNVNVQVRKQLVRSQRAYLQKLAKVRITPKPAKKKAVPKHKKIRILRRIRRRHTGYRGKRFSTHKRGLHIIRRHRPKGRFRRRIRRLRPDRLMSRMFHRRRIIRRHDRPKTHRRIIRHRRKTRRPLRRIIRGAGKVLRFHPTAIAARGIKRLIRRRRSRRPVRRRFFRRRR